MSPLLPIVAVAPEPGDGAREALPLVVAYLPARNESATVADVVRRTLAVGSRHAAVFSLDVVVVDDGSDGPETGEEARRAGARVVRHERSRGLGAATRTGLLEAWRQGAACAVKLDADGQFAPEDLPTIVAPVLAGELDLCWGVRERLDYRMPLVRRVGNRVFTELVRRLTGWHVTDAQTGLFAVSRRFLDGFTLAADYNPPQLMLVDGAHRGLRYGERPIVAQPRTQGRSFVSWRYPLRVGANLARYYLARRGRP
jgi:glycosyltransferase involved in cell wall biosynthesis